MSTVRATNFQNAGSASVNMTLDTAGNATVANTLAMGSSFLRNRIINGDMRIDQRNAGASVTPTSGAYLLDRWSVEMNQASKFSIQQNAGGVTPPAGYTNYLGATSLSAYSVSGSDYFIIGQAIEGFNISDFGWGSSSAQNVTLSFWVRSSLTGTFGGTLVNNGASRNYIYSYTITNANTWEYKTVQISGDTSGTWLTTNGAGLFVRFCIGAASGVTGSAGSWSATINRSVTGQTSIVGTNGATFYITGVQLEVGTVATPFERRQYGQELALCQRYCYRQTGGKVGDGAYFSTTFCYPSVRFPVTMRTAPTITFSSQTGFIVYCAGAARTSTAMSVTGAVNADIAEFQATTSAISTAGFCAAVLANTASDWFQASAEL